MLSDIQFPQLALSRAPSSSVGHFPVTQPIITSGYYWPKGSQVPFLSIQWHFGRVLRRGYRLVPGDLSIGMPYGILVSLEGFDPQ